MMRAAVCAVLLACFFAWVLLPYQTEMTAERRHKYGEWAVIAGASEGLGAAWGDELASHGLNLVLVARSAQKLEGVAEEIRKRRGVVVQTVVADLATLTKEDVEKKIIGDRGIGMLVYNAAYMAGGEFLDQPLDEHLKVIQLNVNSLLTFTHTVASHMKVRGHGGIVLMGSLSGVIGTAYYPTYSSSKSFIESLSRTLWYELEQHNIDVVGCLAGATTTPGYLQVATKSPNRNSFIEQTPEDVASECLAALGKTGAVATGALNKFSHALMKRLLPGDQGMQFISHMTKLQTQSSAR